MHNVGGGIVASSRLSDTEHTLEFSISLEINSTIKPILPLTILRHLRSVSEILPYVNN